MAFGRNKEPNYFHLLAEMTGCASQAAKLLVELVDDYRDVSEKAEAIHDVEHRCDKLLHSLSAQVNAAFITPIDREDLIGIANGIDSITDAIEDSASSFHVYSVRTLEEDVFSMTRLALSSVDALHEAVQAFETYKDPHTLDERIIEVNRIEAEGDLVYKNALRKLYTAPAPSALHILKWEHIFGTLEQILDGCEDVADQLSLVAIKNR